MIRFWSGAAGGVLAGFAAFGWKVFRPDHPGFECVTIGVLLAGMLTLVRMSHFGSALGLVVAYSALRVALSPILRWNSALVGLLVVLGIFVIAVIYDMLARSGLRFGKFILLGPLLGGVYLAVAPIAEAPSMNVFNAASVLVFRLALGVLIGEGVALGFELAELTLATRGRSSIAGNAVTGRTKIPAGEPAIERRSSDLAADSSPHDDRALRPASGDRGGGDS